MRRIKRKRGERILAWILCMAILLQGTPVYAADVQDQIPYTTDIQESDNVQPEIEIEEAEPTPQPEETETGAESDVPKLKKIQKIQNIRHRQRQQIFQVFMKMVSLRFTMLRS